MKFLLLFGVPLVVYLSFLKLRKLRVQRRLEKMSKTPFPEQYEKMLSRFRPYQFLTTEERKRFQTKILYFLEDKIFNAVGDLIITDEMKLLVAAEACLMITNIDGDVYPGLKNIYLMEDVFIPKDNPVNSITGLPTHSARLGEAWKRGPIVLSWNSIVQGSSVVFHEFSHQLDQQDGSFDGTPKLGRNGNYDKWAQVMGKEFINLRKRVMDHKRSDIDSYGATNEAEFFAVVTEYFFTRPQVLSKNHPEIYGLYKNYFQLDPSQWV
ncbi:zinc-dependent peptidase [Peredibacter sp. HCB2-198]|uniref:M90 family metallopeptidase n=1 Tax=Peredibacter sp. HCB2-198 TaxID=3383025 RepID=UPI0038B5A525